MLTILKTFKKIESFHAEHMMVEVKTVTFEFYHHMFGVKRNQKVVKSLRKLQKVLKSCKSAEIIENLKAIASRARSRPIPSMEQPIQPIPPIRSI